MFAVFIDLQKAFDTASHKFLLDKINYYKIRSEGNDWFRSFLTNREKCVLIKGFFSQTKIVSLAFLKVLLWDFYFL